MSKRILLHAAMAAILCSSCTIPLFTEGDGEASTPLESRQISLLYMENEYRIEGKKTDLQGEEFFSAGPSSGAIIEKDGDLYVIFFGSDDPLDIYFNLVLDLVTADFLPPEIRVHAGFLYNYKAVRQKVLDEIDSYLNLNPEGTIYILGHSSGSASAYFCTADLIVNRDCDERLYCMTGASPRAGGAELKKLIEESPAECHRIVNGSDMVPTVPPESMGYRHTGELHRIGPEPDPFYTATLLWVNHHFIGDYCESLDSGLY